MGEMRIMRCARKSATGEERPARSFSLIALFRAIFLGVSHGGLHIPPRRGRLFDPSAYPFLEGGLPEWTAAIAVPQERAPVELPSIDDETIYRVLHRLIIFKGQRLSYRSLDVEQIGAVYESCRYGTGRRSRREPWGRGFREYSRSSREDLIFGVGSSVGRSMNTTSASQEDAIRPSVLGIFQRHPVGGPSQLDSPERVEGSYLRVPPEGDRAPLPQPQDFDIMMARWDEITKAVQDDEDFVLQPPAYAAGLLAIFEIADFLRSYGGLPRPDIFIVRPGNVSFEWQPHITPNLFASISFAQSGDRVELDIHRVEADGEVRTLYSDSRPSVDGLRTFLLHLHAAAVQ